MWISLQNRFEFCDGNRTVRPVLQDPVWGVEEFEFDYHDVNENPTG